MDVVVAEFCGWGMRFKLFEICGEEPDSAAVAHVSQVLVEFDKTSRGE